MDKQSPDRYPTDFYTAVHTGNPGDDEFYVDACAGAGAVLELGCGSGRIARALAEAGHEVCGIDSDHHALKLAAKCGIKTIEGDFTEFKLNQRFDRIIIPYNGFYCLLSEDAMTNCLHSVERHLTSEGMLIMDVYSGDHIPSVAIGSAPEEEWVATRYIRGRLWDVFEKSEIDPQSQRIKTTYIYTAQEDGETVTATLQSRYLLSQQIPDLLARAGLTLSAFHGSFAETPYCESSALFIIRATRQ